MPTRHSTKAARQEWAPGIFFSLNYLPTARLKDAWRQQTHVLVVTVDGVDFVAAHCERRRSLLTIKGPRRKSSGTRKEKPTNWRLDQRRAAVTSCVKATQPFFRYSPSWPS
ncbi:unnamed protein product [Lasius platythorax]|uniref:Uncharacterized protein n=1 Tax=Lasius platythorax TaxID=488582 RepID=A0AAV2P5D9_9HYME